MNCERNSWGAVRRQKSDKLAIRFKIERGIPIPPARAQNGSPTKGYAGVMRRLTRGDSVFLPITSGYASALANRHIGQGNYVTRRTGAGIRIWRTR